MTLRILLALGVLCLIYACTRLVGIGPSEGPSPAVEQAPVTPAPAEQTAALPAPVVPPRQPSQKRGEILVLGDSQISFGAGGAYTAFFENLGANCAGLPPRFANADAAAVGVRSTALHHWTARSGPPRGMICDVDPTYGVNAGAYGVTSKGLSYVQIGADPAYPFCPVGRSPLEAVFDAADYDPDLVILSFLGNAVDRWQTASAARADWAVTAEQLPADVPCIVMTTIPSYLGAENDRRSRAQENLAAAVGANGNCAFVAGFTRQTRAAMEGNAAYFRTDADGTVTDPRHPTAVSARAFMKLQTPALCAALSDVLPN